jgi:acetoin utilization deacetylase AcuC-like enzyme
MSQVFYAAECAAHTTPPGHPESPERADVFAAVATAAGVIPTRVDPATDEELARVHTAQHIATIDATSGRAVMLDADTFTSPESATVARLAAGTAVMAARHAWTLGEPAVALVRPPGHHATADRAMGFCLYNNIAVAAAALRADGVRRLAIVDIDVHHGNGTQSVFYADPTVLYVSTHQYPYYPGTGAADETGRGAGTGCTVNLPLGAGATDEVYRRVYEAQVIPALESFQPEVLLVSAGFDAHVRDPLGGMRVSSPGYRRVVELLDAASRRLCRRRSVWVTEGGYHLPSLQECLTDMIDVLT